MAKKSFLIFLICGAIILLVGVFFILNEKKTIFYLEDINQHHSFNGFQISLMGVSMIILGFALKWILSRPNNHG